MLEPGGVGGSVSHMNMRNGSVASLTISKRGSRSFVNGVAVCLLESVGVDHQQSGSSGNHASVLEYLFHSFKACFSATYEFAKGNKITSQR